MESTSMILLSVNKSYQWIIMPIIVNSGYLWVDFDIIHNFDKIHKCEQLINIYKFKTFMIE